MALVLGTNCGFVTVAPTADPSGTNQGVVDGRATCIKLTVPVGASLITEVGWWCDTASEEANWEAGLYDDDGATVPGEAGTRLQVSATNAKGTSAGWKKTGALTWDVASLVGSTVWLAFQCDNVTTTTNSDYESSGFAGYDGLTASTLADPFGGGALVDSDGIYAIYAVYTTSGGFLNRNYWWYNLG